MKKLFIILSVTLLACGSGDNIESKEEGADTSAVQEATSLKVQMMGTFNPAYPDNPRTDKEKTSDEIIKKEIKQKYKGARRAAVILSNEGWRAFMKGDDTLAMSYFNQAWLADDNFADPYFGFATLHDLQRNQDVAKRYFNKALLLGQSTDRNHDCLHILGNTYESRGDTSRIISAYRMAYQKNKQDSIASGKLAYYFSGRNIPDSAFKYYRITELLDPTYEMTYVNKGWYQFKIGHHETSLLTFNKIIQMNPNSLSGFNGKATMLMVLGLHSEALDALTKCIELDPKQAAYYTERAKCHFILNERDKACADIIIAEEMGDANAIKLRRDNCETES
ncbi:MAG: hypothetical protein IH946_02030 [Bacteroidetes bacterium]|nr:hypothetical protein [Bacteroidota bacterium]